ncbi:MAG: SCP2 sterol-binding domain-containing protein [Chromatiaceae bacterium]|nr:SCP2 sterol-binding domain-containing protein [Chromatiaceae bacterium]
MKTASNRPQLPRVLTLPLRLLPDRLHGVLAARLLERIFAAQRADGELDFIAGKSLRIRVLDAGIDLGLAADANGFVSFPPERATDLVIEGTVYDFLLLITGREDPDTLFFQRRLRISGDTALGVYLKNFLSSVDLDSLPLATLVRPGLDRGLRLYERVFQPSTPGRPWKTEGVQGTSLRAKSKRGYSIS